MATPLPDFERPPVVEVALSVQFDPIESLTTGHLGLLCGKFRDRYPLCQEQPALEQVQEAFGKKRISGPCVRFVANPATEVRLWFLDKTESHLVQVQRDRFVRNWRKGKD